MIDVSDFNLTDYLFNVSKNFNCLTGEDGSIVMANSSFCQGVSVSKYESVSKNFLDFVHPDDRQAAIKWIEDILTFDLRKDLEVRYLNRSGVFEWMAWTSVKLPEQEMLYFSGKDIGPLKAREEKLNIFLTDYQRIFDSSLDVICSIDKDGNYIRLNKAVYKMWGYTSEELLGTNYINYTHPDDVEVTKLVTGKIISGEDLHNFENRFIHKNGSIRYITWSASWSETDQAIFSVARDTTELKKQQETAQLHENRLSSLVKNGSDVIAIRSVDGFYTYVSPSVMQTLGVTPEYCIGKTPYDFLHPDDKHIMEEAFKEVLTCHKIHIPVHRFRDAQGNWRWLQTVTTNCLDDPAINGYICNSIDVTLLKENELRISKQKNKLKEIAQINSHEIRKPVASILGIIQLIDKSAIKDELNITLLEHLKTVTEELDNIIKRVVSNSQEDEGNDGK